MDIVKGGAGVTRDKITPFLIRAFVKMGGFHRLNVLVQALYADSSPNSSGSFSLPTGATTAPRLMQDDQSYGVSSAAPFSQALDADTANGKEGASSFPNPLSLLPHLPPPLEVLPPKSSTSKAPMRRKREKKGVVWGGRMQYEMLGEIEIVLGGTGMDSEEAIKIEMAKEEAKAEAPNHPTGEASQTLPRSSSDEVDVDEVPVEDVVGEISQDAIGTLRGMMPVIMTLLDETEIAILLAGIQEGSGTTYVPHLPVDHAQVSRSISRSCSRSPLPRSSPLSRQDVEDKPIPLPDEVEEMLHFQFGMVPGAILRPDVEG
ncbi:hypothetical protein BKA70DRAFT_1222968 [Coprinopsis sp. MPI-PUGE-AT-0042]|nr:hypothetical protein BKA70DRAFT_1222968 [Coprinopsis sp. MPI-PUGE-AT-0042]